MPYEFVLLMMDVFLTIVQARSNVKASSEEYSWLQRLFKVVSENLYKPSFFNVQCEDLCLDILDILLARNENKLPIDHTVLSPSSLTPFQGGKYFTGQFGQISKSAKTNSEPANGNILEERPLILLGFLTDTPTSDKPEFPESGFLYLEDLKRAIICQSSDECGLEKHMLNNLLLLTNWNYISVKFPIAVFQSQKGDSKRSSFLKYIEVVENMICIHKQETSVVPKALSVQEYNSKRNLIKSNVERMNIYGCLRSLTSPSPMSGQEPYFLAQIYSPETEAETTLAFKGFRFASWYHLMNIGETYVVTNVVQTTMNQGLPGERALLATISRKADFFKVDAEMYEGSQKKDSELKKPEGDETSKTQLKRKRNESEKEQQTENTKRCRKIQECSGFRVKKSDIYTASSPICYEGVITNILQANIGLYEIDGKFRLLTHYSPGKKLGCGMRTGATVTLYHVHLCKRGQKVLGLVCCHLSTIRITKHSMLDTKFQAFFPSASNDWRKFRRLPLTAFCDVLQLRENLSKMFQGLLSEKDILGAKMCWCDRARPCILSHLVDLKSWMSISSRDDFDEFFSNPHHCIVTDPVDDIKIPNLWTLKDLLSSVDTSESNRNVNFQAPRGQYAWNYHEITHNELSEDLILCGWISYGKASGKLYLCNANASVLCLITEREISQNFHKCDVGCIMRRHDRKSPILPCNDEINATCPLPQTLHLGAIVKITSFKVVVETFRGLGPVGKESENRNNLLRKIYLVFSARDAVVIGKIPGFNRAGDSEKKNMPDPGKNKDEAMINRSSCRLVFRVKHKELPALQFKNSSHSLVACVHGCILKSSHGLISKTGSENQQQVIKFTNNCHWLQTLHSGKIYAIIENDHEDKKCHIEKTPVIITTSNVQVEEIDPDEYKNCLPSEQLDKIDSVRSYLSKWENRNPKRKSESTKFLVSLRGVILTRETVVSMDNECPSPDTPSDHLFLPHYGPIPKEQANVLSLGYQYLGQRTMVLTVQDVLTADCVKIYLNFSTRPYPLGLLPGAVVTFEHVQHHISKQGNVYLSFEACSGIRIESLAIGMSSNITKSQENPHMGMRQIVEYINFQKCGKLVCTLSYVSCRIVAVQKVDLRWICSVCGLTSRNSCSCHARAGKQTFLLHAKVQCVIEDGTGEAMAFIEGEELVKNVLFVKDSTWISIKNLSKNDGEVSYTRGAYWKTGQACSYNKAEQTLNSTISSAKMYRRIKMLCRQFSVGNIEDQKKETRKIWLDRRQFVTEALPKIMLNVLEIQEINYRKELRTMISDHEKRLLND